MKTQMNIRIDERVKERGDAAFAGIGWTPSRAVQVVWEIAATDNSFPALLKDMSEKPEQSAALLQNEALKEEVLAGARIIDSFYETTGIPKPNQKEDVDYRALREAAFNERELERG